MTGVIPDQIDDALGVYQDEAWQRTSVGVFRPVSSPDGQGGITVTVASTATLTVAADPVSQQDGQTLLVDEGALVRVGDLVKIQRSQFRSYS